ncbi:acyl-CoA dehydrogenase family protein [Actinophytocola sp.]|uniref:acyl-CoA dehydrogenase family protein n=1 Tax=Actinophytocola sp. TaxID=1872138 RepID=UPI003D6AF08E
MAEFIPAPEVGALREVVRDHCRRVWDEPAVRAVSEDGKAVTDAWQALGTQLGVLGLGVPEKWRGSGAGTVAAAAAAEELGGALAPVPYLSAAFAARLLVDSGDEAACGQLLADLCTGSRTFAVVGTDASGDWGRPSTVASRGPDGWRLDGAAASVVDGPVATDLLVVTEGPALFHVDVAAAGVTRDPVPTLDLTRPQADLRFVSVPARRVGDAVDLAGATSVVVTLLAAELVGVARTMLDTAVSYAKSRLQFGRPIGSFQAVKQRCADMLVELELARSVADHAAWTHDHGGDDPALATSLAQVVTTDAARRVTGDALQVLGGVGFTWEHPAHLYYKRAVAAAALWGGRAHRDRLAALAIDGEVDAEERDSHVR